MITLIRHGETTSNVALKLDTALPGATLTGEGVRQAREAAQILQGASGLYCSEALRARQTASEMHPDFHVMGGMFEVQAGHLEDRSDEEALNIYHGAVRQWLHGEEGTIPGGETIDGFLTRFQQGFDTLPDGAVLVSHGCAIRVFAALACGLDADAVMDHPLQNCEWVGIEKTDAFGQWTLIGRDEWL